MSHGNRWSPLSRPEKSEVAAHCPPFQWFPQTGWWNPFTTDDGHIPQPSPSQTWIRLLQWVRWPFQVSNRSETFSSSRWIQWLSKLRCNWSKSELLSHSSLIGWIDFQPRACVIRRTIFSVSSPVCFQKMFRSCSRLSSTSSFIF